jgi:hypothetical protein
MPLASTKSCWTPLTPFLAGMAAVALLLAVCWPTRARAAAGELDPSFGSGGFVRRT